MSSSSKQTLVFITGATGYIGSVVTEYCIKEGYKVRGLSRSESGDEKLKALGATPVRGDLSTLNILRQESSEADVIFHLAFVVSLRDFEEAYAENKAAVDAMCEPLVGPAKPLVITSGSLVVAPDPDHGETTEDSPPTTSPLLGRLRSDQYALTWAKKDIRITCLRLAAFVYGRGGSGFLPYMMQMAKKNGESIYIDDGSTCTATAHVDDIAQLYLLTAKSAKAGETFNGTNDTTVTFKQMAEAVGKVLQVPVRSVKKYEAEKLWNPFFAMIFSMENRPSSQKAKEQLGWKPSGIDFLSDLMTGSYVQVAERIHRGENMDKFQR